VFPPVVTRCLPLDNPRRAALSGRSRKYTYCVAASSSARRRLSYPPTFPMRRSFPSPSSSASLVSRSGSFRIIFPTLSWPTRPPGPGTLPANSARGRQRINLPCYLIFDALSTAPLPPSEFYPNHGEAERKAFRSDVNAITRCRLHVIIDYAF